MTPDEDLTPAELRVREFLHGLASDAAPPAGDLSTRVVRAARWQRAVRTPLRAVGGLASAVRDGVELVIGTRRRTSS